MVTNDSLNLTPLESVNDNITFFNWDEILIANVHYPEGPVGLTLLDFPNGVTIYEDVRGGDPARIVYNSINFKRICHSICIAGGSILGLESMTGVTVEKFKQTNYTNFTGLCGSIIYSYNLLKNSIYPDKELGRYAVNKLRQNQIYNGKIGAGVSAYYGLGSSFYEFKNGIKLLAIVVNNATGNIYKDGKCIQKNSSMNYNFERNTTISVLVTNIVLDIDKLKQMACQVHSSMAETIKPFNTFADGDVFYSCSTNTLDITLNNLELIEIFIKGSQIINEAILKSL